MEDSKSFIYWKRAWQKWLTLAAGVLQVISLWLNMQKYREIAKVKDLIFSSAAWTDYALQQTFLCTFNGFSAAFFFGIFFVGILARSQKAARISEGLIVLILTFLWGGIGFILPIRSQIGITILWVGLLLSLFVGSMYALWKIKHNE